MLFEVATPSGTTLLQCPTQREALQCACLVSVAQHAPILVYCHHLGGHTHLVARLNDGELIPFSSRSA